MSFWAWTDMLSGSLCSYRLLGLKLLLRTLFWEWRNCLLIVFKKDTSRNFRHPILKYVLCTYKVNFKNLLLVFVIYVLSHIFPTSWLTLFLSCGKVQSATLYWCIESINLILIYRNIDIFLIYSDHTWYLSFFLHWQNFWRIKFTPKNANFSLHILHV